MKKMTFMACAAMLTSMFALNSCKSEDPINSGSEDKDAVKTEFAISLPDNATGGSRRMPDVTVQDGDSLGVFQGMTNIFLVPFVHQRAITGADARLDKNILLTPGVSKADINKTSKAKVYGSVTIPLTTGSFLFYAKSAKADGSKFNTGSLIVKDTASANPSDFKFCLDTIFTGSAEFTADTTALLAYLTSIACADDGLGKAKSKWYQYDGDSAAMQALFNTYTSMTGLSTFEVQRVLTDLNKTLKPLTSSPMATAIRTAIANATYATVGGDDTVRLTSITNFPKSYKLPEGSVIIEWNGTSHRFVGGSYHGDTTALDHFVYPAQLWYRANSTIKTNNKSLLTSYSKDSTLTWPEILAKYTGAAAVNSLTRSVAIKDTIQYAVARLDVQVKVKQASMEDNSEAVEGVKTDVDCTGGFPVTGILVGGQKNVGFDFTPITSDEFTIYDSIMSSTVAGTPTTMLAGVDTYSTLNHTLVLESQSSKDVMVAIEMKNTTGKDFYGASGQLIPKNGKFYVVAKLEYAAGAGRTINTPNQVFKQDYITTARLSLKDLKNAYNTIPDLRTPELEIGFTVDLTWKAGNVYEFEF